MTVVCLTFKYKLSPLSFGPYKIIERVRDVAYKLELPPNLLIHPTFYVSKLKKSVKRGTTMSLVLSNALDVVVVTICILNRKMVKSTVIGLLLNFWCNGLMGFGGSYKEYLYDLEQKFITHTLRDMGVVRGRTC